MENYTGRQGVVREGGLPGKVPFKLGLKLTKKRL